MTPVKNPLLRRYWLEFDLSQGPEPAAPGWLGWGCGVTAFTVDDALRLVRKHVFQGAPMVPVSRIIEDVDTTTLDAGHIRPNMDEPISRGIWFPMGYRPSGGSP